MVVEYRKEIEKTYDHICNIFIKKENKNPETFEIEFIEEAYVQNQHCRISFKNISSTTNDDVSEYSQQIKLFIDEKIEILEGSVIEVIVNGEKTLYKQSGKPALYPCHQEIILKVEEFA